MKHVLPAAVSCLLLVGCGSGGSSGTVTRSPDGKALIETQIAPNGAKVIEFTIGSGASGSLPAGLLPPEAEAEYARIASEVQLGEVGYYRYVGPGAATTTPTTQALPDVAGVPQTLTSQTTGNTTTQTFTYGTPPAAAPSSLVRRSAVPQQTRGCSLQMTGGSGYRCAGGN